MTRRDFGAVFDVLTDRSMAVTYIFDASLEGAFVDAVRHIDAHRDCSFGVKQDPATLSTWWTLIAMSHRLGWWSEWRPGDWA